MQTSPMFEADFARSIDAEARREARIEDLERLLHDLPPARCTGAVFELSELCDSRDADRARALIDSGWPVLAPAATGADWDSGTVPTVVPGVEIVHTADKRWSTDTVLGFEDALSSARLVVDLGVCRASDLRRLADLIEEGWGP